MPVATDAAVELDPVIAWRIAVLTSAGYPYAEAFEIAANAEINLHTAVYLIESGCTLTTAMRILL